MMSPTIRREGGPPTLGRSEFIWRVAVVASVLVGFGLRAHRLAAQSLWSDEDITLDRSQLSAAEIVATLPPEHTPLYFIGMAFWTDVAGETDYVLRFPSALAGALAVAATAVVGAALAGRSAGAIAALVVATNPFMVWYGQDARMYALLSALGLVTLAVALRARNVRRRRWWVVTGLLGAACIYTHWYGALTAVVLGAWGGVDIVAGRTRGRASRGRASGWATRGWGVAGAVTVASLLPWAPRVPGLFAFQGWREPVPLREVPALNLAAWTAGETVPADWVPVAEAVYLVLAAIGLAVLAQRAVSGSAGSRAKAVRALLFGIAPLGVAAVLVARQADFHPRYFVAVVPALYVWAALGAAVWRSRIVRAVAAAVLIAVALPSLGRLYGDPAAQKQDYRSFVAAVEAAAGHEDTVLFLDGPSYGLSRRYEMEDSPVKIVNVQSSGNLERGPESLRAEIAELAGEYPNLWLASDGEAVGDAGEWLDVHAQAVASEPFQNITLRRYLATP